MRRTFLGHRRVATPFRAGLLAASFAGGLAAWGEVAAPLLVPKTGDSTVALDVIVTCATEGAVIRYTTNGTLPTVGDPTVADGGTVRISRNSIVTATAWLGGESSSVTTEDYRVTGAVVSGYEHGLALSTAGRMWGWGNQGSGRLGNGSTTAVDVLSPEQVLKAVGYFDDGAAISAGYDHSAVIDQDWNVWAFGENDQGQLGDNGSADSAVPVRVLKSTTAGDFLGSCVDVDSGERFSVALSSLGTLHSWGTQATGRLGNGTISSSAKRHAVEVRRGDDPSYPVLSGVRAIAVGNAHGVAREAHFLEEAGGLGRVWVWGHNHAGQLGQGNTSGESRALPMKLDADTELTDAIDADGGGNFSAVVRWNDTEPDLQGTVWTVGSNSNGRLGVGTMDTPSVSFPARVKTGNDSYLTDIYQISAGSSHTLALDANGKVWAWGNNQYGQLGDGTTTHNGYARMVHDSTGTSYLEDIVMVSAGGDGTQGSSMALASDGTIWVWGRNDHGQLGNGETSLATMLPVAHTPNRVDEGEPSVWVSLSVAAPVAPGSVELETFPSHSSEAGIYAIDRVEVHLDGTLIATLSDGSWATAAAGLAAGDHRCVAIVYDVEGKAAMSPPVDFRIYHDPSQIPQPLESYDPTVTTEGDFSVGSSHRLAVRWNRTAWGWGSQENGRLGNNVSSGTATDPVKVVSNSNTPQFENPVKVAAGDNHSLAIDHAGRVWAFGANSKLQIGNGTANNRLTPYPVQISTSQNLGNCESISAGTNFSLALGSLGEVWAWGWQSEGRLGDGIIKNSGSRYAARVTEAGGLFPQLTGIRAISAGHGHGIARKPDSSEVAGGDGRVLAWGSNTNGQLGIGNLSSQGRAATVKLNANSDLVDIIAASAGRLHSVFVRRTGFVDGRPCGDVLSAGSELYGKLGNGTDTATNETYPVQVKIPGGAVLQNIVSASAGPRHTLAVDVNGAVWAWGYNGSGELGTNNKINSAHAIRVSNPEGEGLLSGITRVFAGGADGAGCSYAMTASGRIYAWGFNGDGSLGAGGTSDVLLPVLLEGISVGNWQPLAKLGIHQPDLDDPETFSLVGSAVDLDGPSDIAGVSFFKGEQLLQALTSPPWVIPAEGLSRGTHEDLKIVVTDRSGATGQSAPIQFRHPLRSRQLQSPPYPDWDADGIPDASDHGGVENWRLALRNAVIDDPDTRGLTGAINNQTNLIGVWDFEAGSSNTPGFLTIASIPNLRGSGLNGVPGPFTFEFNNETGHGITWDRSLVPDPLNWVAMERGMPSAAIHVDRQSASGSFAPRNFRGLSEQTWTMWIKFPAGALAKEDNGEYMTLFSQCFNGVLKGGYPDLHCYFDLENAQIAFDSYTFGSAPGLVRTRMANLPIPHELDDGKWHHLMVGFGPGDPTTVGAYRVWLDGTKRSEASAALGPRNKAVIGTSTDPSCFVYLGKSKNAPAISIIYPRTVPLPEGGFGTQGRTLDEVLLGASIDRMRIYRYHIASAEQARDLYRQDADGDSLWDITEFRGYYWRDANGNRKREPGEADSDPFHWNHPQVDHDNDGLATFDEQGLKTNPFEADSDGDGFTDGWEVKYQFDPTDVNDPPSANGHGDSDGLTNAQEAFHGTNPRLNDTDGDGAWDNVEIGAGTDPLDPWNFPMHGGGVNNISPPGYNAGALAALQPIGALSAFGSQSPPSAPSNVVQVKVGDPSGSHSEDWSLYVGTVGARGRRINPVFQDVSVDRRRWQPVKLVHHGSQNPSEGPDYDYVATMKFQDESAFVLYDGSDTALDETLGGYKGNLLKEFIEEGKTSDTAWSEKEAYLIPIEKQSASSQLTISGNDAAGPKYRKISLEGRPIADVKPEAQAESDHDSEETYVDAYDLSLRHDTSFAYVPLASSDLKLQATASLTESIWTDRSGLAPHESLTTPFGVCWTSSLCSYVEVIESIGGGSFDPISINVVDEDGRSQRFTSNGDNEFIPWPSSRTDKKTLLNKLERNGDGSFTFRKRYGNELTFMPTTAWFAYSSNRLDPTHTGRRHTYWRLDTVTDRFGTTLKYDYGNIQATGTIAADSFTTAQLGAALIPGRIHSPERPGQQIVIKRSANLRRIDSIVDPRQKVTSFDYSPLDWTSQSSTTDQPQDSPPASVARSAAELKLTTISFPDGTTQGFTYNVVPDLERRVIQSASEVKYRFTDYIHVNLGELTNRRGKKTAFAYGLNTYTFTYSADSSTEGFYAAAVDLDGLPFDAVGYLEDALEELNGGPPPATFANQDVLQVHGLPRLLSSVVLPGPAGSQPSAQFIRNAAQLPNSTEEGSYVMFAPDENGRPSYKSKMATKVIDAESNITNYAFTGLHGEIVDIDIEGSYQGATSTSSSVAYEWMLYYTGLAITFCDPTGAPIGSESYTFDLSSGLELASVTDFSGNRTDWLFDPATPLPPGTVAGIQGLNGTAFMTSYPEPHRKLEALEANGNRRHESFHYDTVSRRMDRHTDGHGTVTEVVFTDHDLPKIKTISDGSGLLLREVYDYDNTDFPGFMTRKTVEALGGAVAPDWETDLVVDYLPDNNGRLFREIVDPGGLNLITEYGYDPNNNRTSVKDPRDHVTSFHFDSMNRLYRTDYPPTHGLAGDLTSSALRYFDQNGALAAESDENGRWDVFVRDDRGRVEAKIRLMDSQVVPSPNSNQILADADLASIRGIAEAAGSPHLVDKITYNKVGSVTMQFDARGSGTMTFYDALQRPLHVLTGCDPSLPYWQSYAIWWAGYDRTNTHTEFTYDQQIQIGSQWVDANPGSSAFVGDGFKPTLIRRVKAVREGVLNTANTDSTLETYAAYDAAYRSIYVAEKYASAATGYDDGWNVTSTSYGPPLAGQSGLYTEPPVVKVTDDLGRTTEMKSDGMGRVIETTEALGTADERSRYTKYTGTGLAWRSVETVTASSVRHTETEYDAAGRPTKVFQPDPASGLVTENSPVTETVYDDSGNPSLVVGPRGPATTVENSYDARNRLWKTVYPEVVDATDPDAPVSGVKPESYRWYDGVGNVVKELDVRNSATISFYDFANRRYEQRVNAVSGSPSPGPAPGPTDIVTTTIFDKGGQIIRSTDGNGNVTNNAYDLLGRLIVTVVNPDPGSTTTPDPNDPSFNIYDYQQPGSTVIVVSSTYDDAGNLVELKDGKGQKTGFTYDGKQRKTRTIWDPGAGALERVELQQFDSVQVKERLDASARRTVYLYDSLNRLTGIVYGAETGQQLSAELDNENRSYDLAGRLLSVTYPNEPCSLREVWTTYDFLDRVLTTTDRPNQYALHWKHYTEYDKAGNLKSADFGSFSGYGYSFDNQDRTESITEFRYGPNPVERETHYAYDRGGKVTRKSLPNGVQTTCTYDYLGRLLRTEDRNQAGALISASDYTAAAGGWPTSYDGAGNVLRIEETNTMAGLPATRVVANQYDRANRLLAESVSSGSGGVVTTAYTYDAAYNRLTKTKDGITTGYTYGNGANGYNSNQLISFGPAGGSPTRTFFYNEAGNRVKRATGTTEDHYVWNFENRLIETTLSSGTGVNIGVYEYAYDHRGRRVVRDETRTTGGSKSVFIFSGGDSIGEYDLREMHDRDQDPDNDGATNYQEYQAGTDPINGNPGTIYTAPNNPDSYKEWAVSAIPARIGSAVAIHRMSTRVAKARFIRGLSLGGPVGGLLYSYRGDQESSNGFNSRGDVISTTDSNGAVTWQASYEAFGTRSVEAGVNLERQRASTKDEDPTGLLNEGLRYRDLETGMFISRDPAGFVDGPNVYTYVRQNPWTMFDPEGLQAWTSFSALPGVSQSNPGFHRAEMKAQHAASAGMVAGGVKLVTGAAMTLGSWVQGKPMADPTAVSQAFGKIDQVISNEFNVDPEFQSSFDFASEGTVLAGVVVTAGRSGGGSNGTGGKSSRKTKTDTDAQVEVELTPAQGKTPAEAYNRRKHYGSSPTQADRKAVGAGEGQVADHTPPLVKRYYEGDPATGEKPGFLMTDAERRASAQDRMRMSPQPRSESDKQGGIMSQYSKEKKKEHGL